MGLIKSLIFFSLFVFSPVLVQSVPMVSLPAEIFRLETITSGTSPARERYEAFMDLARLHKLSGNHRARLESYSGALALFPNDSRALLEQGRFFVSVGEYERAEASIDVLLRTSQDRNFLNQGRYLAAKLKAFRSGDTRYLAALADDADFIDFHSSIFYTLWRITGHALYLTRLTTEFPQSPEARITSGAVSPAATPLWLLFPGRDSLVLSQSVIVSQPVLTSPAADTTPAVNAPAGRLLQTGLFGQESNAAIFAQQIRRAGFEPQLVQRLVNGRYLWAVCVAAGDDINAMIRRLRDAGFESFPLP